MKNLIDAFVRQRWVAQKQRRIGKPVDVLLIGGGIMSATLYLSERTGTRLTIEMVERLDKVAEESPTAEQCGHRSPAFCELNYTSEAADGSMDISKAVAINENLRSPSSWAYQVDRKVLNDPKSFINNVPHMSFVWGDDNVASRSATPPCSTARCSAAWYLGRPRADQAVGAAGDGRPRAGQKIAATRMSIGTDVNPRRDHPPVGGLAVGHDTLRCVPANMRSATPRKTTTPGP